ncbi:MAG: hypothetical protein ACTSPB_21620 [Candidatus Thorarchaeota archaeon]
MNAIEKGEKVQEIEVRIKLAVPEEMQIGQWQRETAITDYIEHWLKEGYYIHDGEVILPQGIEVIDLEIWFGEYVSLNNGGGKKNGNEDK